MTKLSRRNFIAAAAGVALGMAGAQARGAAVPAADFEFVLFGDVHYDKLAHHDMTWLARDHPGDVHQVQNYSRITREVVPSLYEEAKSVIAAAPRPMPFSAHIGDLVEGLCGTPELARLQCTEALGLVQGTHLGNPMLLTKGNHDITGPGAQEAFDTILMPAMTPPETRDPHSASFTRRQGDTLLLFFDAYKPSSLEWAEQTLKHRTERNLIFLTHPPVVPYNARSNWHIFAKPQDKAQRQRLLTLLGANRAVVLTGHLHKYSTVVRKTDAGPFVQLALCSVIPTAAMQPRDIRMGLDQYSPELVALEPRFSPNTLAERRALLLAEKPFIRHYDYADVAGYAILSVQGPKVQATLYNGLGKRFWKTIDLTGLLAEA